MNSKSLRRGIIYVFIANIVNLIFSLLTNFVFPKYLMVDTYAEIKSFHLYVSYIGLLSLGYVDGMYLRYGGKNLSNIDNTEINSNEITFIWIQIIITIIITIFSLIFNNLMLLLLSFVIFPLNMSGYYRSLYQATGEFSDYSKSTNITAMLTFVVNMTLVFIFKVRNTSIPYFMLYVIVDFIIFGLLFKELRIRYKKNLNFFFFSIEQMKASMKDGIALMLGNFSSILLTSMDRWFIKLFMSNMVFAMYSFAVSMEGFLNVAISPVTITLYNYFCKGVSDKEIIQLRKSIEIFAVGIVTFAFPAKFVLEIFVPNYLDSSIVMFLLFGSQIAYIIVKSIYVNLYKAKGLQKRYFIKLLTVIGFGFLTNCIFYYFFRVKEAFAFATLLSALYWLVICQFDFKNIKMNIQEVVFVICCIFLFIIFGTKCSSIVGFLLYVVSVVFLVFIFMRDGVKNIIRLIPQKYRIKNDMGN